MFCVHENGITREKIVFDYDGQMGSWSGWNQHRRGYWIVRVFSFRRKEDAGVSGRNAPKACARYSAPYSGSFGLDISKIIRRLAGCFGRSVHAPGVPPEVESGTKPLRVSLPRQRIRFIRRCQTRSSVSRSAEISSHRRKWNGALDRFPSKTVLTGIR